MPLKVRCQCGQMLKVPDTRAGGSVRCPVCEQRVLIPASAPPPPPQAPASVEPRVAQQQVEEEPSQSSSPIKPAARLPAANTTPSRGNGKPEGRSTSARQGLEQKKRDRNVAKSKPSEPNRPIPSADKARDNEADASVPPLRDKSVNGHAARIAPERAAERKLPPPSPPRQADDKVGDKVDDKSKSEKSYVDKQDSSDSPANRTKPPPLPQRRESPDKTSNPADGSTSRPSSAFESTQTAPAPDSGSFESSNLVPKPIVRSTFAQPESRIAAAPVARSAPDTRPDPEARAAPAVDQHAVERRGVAADSAKRRSVNWLAAGVACAAGLNVALLAVDVVLDLQQPRPSGVSNWALLLLLLGVVQGGYALYLFQLPDWSSLWVASIVMLVLSAGYAMLLAVLALGGGNTPLSTALELDEFADQRPELVCLIMLALSGLLSYLLGRLSQRWRKSAAGTASTAIKGAT